MTIFTIIEIILCVIWSFMLKNEMSQPEPDKITVALVLTLIILLCINIILSV